MSTGAAETGTKLCITELLSELDTYAERIPLEVLGDRLARLELCLDDVKGCVHFDDEHYRRNLLHSGPAYSALILCWKNGQRSPIHDHEGSSCGVRVIHGTATETVFEWARNGMVVPTVTREYEPGCSMCSQDSDMHQVSNLQDGGEDLITLHIYSPPLARMNVFSLMGTEVRRSIDRSMADLCEHGAGI